MQQSKGFGVLDSEHLVCKLKKALNEKHPEGLKCKYQFFLHAKGLLVMKHLKMSMSGLRRASDGFSLFLYMLMTCSPV